MSEGAKRPSESAGEVCGCLYLGGSKGRDAFAPAVRRLIGPYSSDRREREYPDQRPRTWRGLSYGLLSIVTRSTPRQCAVGRENDYNNPYQCFFDTVVRCPVRFFDRIIRQFAALFLDGQQRHPLAHEVGEVAARRRQFGLTDLEEAPDERLVVFAQRLAGIE